MDKTFFIQQLNYFRHFQVKDIFNPETSIAVVPTTEWPFAIVYMLFIVLCLAGVIVFTFIKKLDEQIRLKWSTFFWTNLILSGILFFLRYQTIPLLGMDILRTIQLFADIIWVILILKYSLIDHKRILIAQKVQEHKEKYLPKAKM